jgi:hypothetical protein
LVIRAPKGHESLAPGLPWVCCFMAVRPVGAPKSGPAGQKDRFVGVASILTCDRNFQGAYMGVVLRKN